MDRTRAGKAAVMIELKIVILVALVAALLLGMHIGAAPAPDK